MTDAETYVRARSSEAAPANGNGKFLAGDADAEAEVECLEQLDDMAGEVVPAWLLLTVYCALFAMMVVGVIVLRSLETAS